MLSDDPKQTTYSRLERVTNLDHPNDQITNVVTDQLAFAQCTELNLNQSTIDNHHHLIDVHESSSISNYYHNTNEYVVNHADIVNIVNEVELINTEPDHLEIDNRPKKKATLISSKRPKLIDYKAPSKQTRPIKTFDCDSCKKVFNRRFHLVRHQQTACNKPKPQFVCDKCGKTYTRKDNLLDHLKSHDDAQPKRQRPKRFECDECGKCFQGEKQLIIHNRIHTGQKPFDCEQCDKSFVSNDALIKHRRVHTNEKPYECLTCNQRFALKSTLDRHELTHTNTRPFMCQYCKKRFIQKSGLTAHLFYHTGENGFNCETCDRVFNRKARLQMHIHAIHEKERSLTCKTCSRNFARRADLIAHQQSHNLSSETSYDCEICRLKFAFETSLRIHKLMHEAKQMISKCSNCDRVFLTTESLNRHEKSEHVEMRQRNMNLDVDHLDIDLVNIDDSNEFIEISEIEMNEIGDNAGFDSAGLLINSMNDRFSSNLKHFLWFLMDDNSSDKSNWSNLSSQEALDQFIRKYKHEPIRNVQFDQYDQLRANLNLLFTISEEAKVKSYLNDHSVDEVLLYLVQSKF